MESLKKKRKLTIITPLYRVFFLLDTNKSVNIYKNYLATIPVSTLITICHNPCVCVWKV